MSSLTISALWLNNNGGSYQREESGTFERFTIGNLDTGRNHLNFKVDEPSFRKNRDGQWVYDWKKLKQNYTLSEIDYKIVSQDEYQKSYEDSVLDQTDKRNKQIAAIDFCVSMTFLAFILFYRERTNRKIEHYCKNITSVSKYAIQATGFPKSGVTKKEIYDFFAKYGNIHELVLGYNYNNLINLYNQKGECELKISAEKLLSEQKQSKGSKKKLVKLEKELGNIDEKLRKQTSHSKSLENRKILKAFIIYEKQESKYQCLKDYRFYGMFTWWLQPKRLKFQGTNSLQVYEAQDPTLVLWENLEVGRIKSSLLSFISLVASCLIVAGSLVSIYGIKQIQANTLPTPSECRRYYNNVKEYVLRKENDIDIQNFDLELAKRTYSSAKDDTGYQCWCGEQDLDDVVLQKGGLGDFCDDWLVDYVRSCGVAYFISATVIISNQILKSSVKWLSKMQKKQDLSDANASLGFKLASLQFFNQAFTIFVINLVDYTDFTRE